MSGPVLQMEYKVPKYTPAPIQVTSWLTSSLVNDLFIWNIISGFGRAAGNFLDIIMGAVTQERGKFLLPTLKPTESA